jgi:hypothetical protein
MAAHKYLHTGNEIKGSARVETEDEADDLKRAKEELGLTVKTRRQYGHQLCAKTLSYVSVWWKP